MRVVVTLAALAAVAVVAAGCGGQSSAEVSFRTKANQACRSVARDVLALPPRSQHKLAIGLGLLQESATRLARVHPPARDASTFRDLIARLHGAAVSSKANSAEVYALDQRFEREMKSFGSRILRGDKVPHSIPHLVERINAMARTPLRDITLAGKDARALDLGACAFKTTDKVTVGGLSG